MIRNVCRYCTRLAAPSPQPGMCDLCWTAEDPRPPVVEPVRDRPLPSFAFAVGLAMAPSAFPVWEVKAGRTQVMPNGRVSVGPPCSQRSQGSRS